jgi:hypothetical protein
LHEWIAPLELRKFEITVFETSTGNLDESSLSIFQKQGHFGDGESATHRLRKALGQCLKVNHGDHFLTRSKQGFAMVGALLKEDPFQRLFRPETYFGKEKTNDYQQPECISRERRVNGPEGQFLTQDHDKIAGNQQSQ